MNNRSSIWASLLPRGYLFLSILASGGIYGVLWGAQIKFFLLLFGIFSIGLLSYGKRSSLVFSKFDISLLYTIILFSVLHSGINFLWTEDLSHYRALIIAFTCSVLYLRIRNYDKREIMNDFYYCLLLIMWHAFINLLLSLIIPNQFYPMSYEISSDSIYSTYKNIFFISSSYSTENMDVSTVIFRLNGWFWEPGVLQFYLNILLYQILFVKRKCFKLLYIIIPSLVATFSTTGMIIMMIMILTYWLRRKNDFKKFVIGILISIILIPIGSFIVYNKFTDSKQQSSATARTVDTILPLLISVENPVCGLGLGNDDAYFKELKKRVPDSSLHDRGVSNGISSSFMYLGAVTAFIFWILYVCSPLWKGNRLLLIVFLLGFIGEPIVFTIIGLIPFVFSLYFLIFCRKKKYNNENFIYRTSFL